MPLEPRDDLLITDPEWQAVLAGARALRQVGAALQEAGFDRSAADAERHAASLDDLARHATVAAERPGAER
jgi:hypothetical protein